MGLDIVELVLDVEEAFAIDIPHVDAPQLTTPGQLIDYICARLGERRDGPPLVQSAFYQIRAAAATELTVERRLLAPSTTLEEIAPSKDVDAAWDAIAFRLGAKREHVTSAGLGRLWDRARGAAPWTLGRAAEQLAVMEPAVLKRSGDGWTRQQVVEVVYRTLDRVTAMDMRPFGLDAEFVRDLGMG